MRYGRPMIGCPRTVGPLLAVALAGFMVGCSAEGSPRAAPADTRPAPLGFEVLATIPHDPAAFTQGLEFDGERLFESTGGYGLSTVRELDPASGAVRRNRRLPPGAWGEGLTVSGGELVQLTFREEVAFRYDRRTLARRGADRYRGEGWGICRSGARLIMSNGSARLALRRPADLSLLRRVVVRRAGVRVPRLNELECVRGRVWANVFHTNEIVRIDLQSGAVDGILDLTALVPPGLADGEAVLNGIAHHPASDTFYVTGKLWPVMYRLRVSE